MELTIVQSLQSDKIHALWKLEPIERRYAFCTRRAWGWDVLDEKLSLEEFFAHPMHCAQCADRLALLKSMGFFNSPSNFDLTTWAPGALPYNRL
jgi:hypothetical protein